jgi:drug/metabolite transporter (DMT)-like permease
MQSQRFVTILQALFVTFLWSTSWVFIKIGLNDIHIPALIFAGLRYSMAFGVLLAYGRYTHRLSDLQSLSRRDGLVLCGLGFVFYTITQGTQFLALSYLPSALFSLMLNFTTIVVALVGIKFLREYPTRVQWSGMVVFLAGVLIYLYPINFPSEIMLGLVIGTLSTLANAGGSVLGRYVNRDSAISPFIVTLVSMGFGAFLLLGVGLLFEDLPLIPIEGWGIILWLAVVNTAFAFTLWNLTLQTLSATESSVINNTMLIQIAVLAWIFLGEGITLQEGIGLLVASVGILIVQVRLRKVQTA